MKIHPLLFICALAVSGSVAAQSAVEQAQARSAAKAAAAKAAAEEKAAAEKAAAEKAAAEKAAAEKAAAAAAPPAKVYREGVVKVGDEMKDTLGKVTDVDKGDNGCFITMRNEKNNEIIELGKMEFCTQKPSLKGKKVALEYRMETVQAASCYGDPKCKKTEVVPLIVAVKVLD